MVADDSEDDDAQDHRLVGAALRRLRERAGLTQEELAASVGTAPSYLSQLENGHRGVRWHTVMRLLRALDADLRDLVEEYERDQAR